MWTCPDCGTENPGNFCGKCGAKKKVRDLTVPSAFLVSTLIDTFRFLASIDHFGWLDAIFLPLLSAAIGVFILIVWGAHKNWIIFFIFVWPALLFLINVGIAFANFIFTPHAW